MASKYNLDPKYLDMLRMRHEQDIREITAPTPPPGYYLSDYNPTLNFANVTATRSTVCLEVLLVKFIMGHIKENVYWTLQRILNLRKRRLSWEATSRFLDMSMYQGLQMTGYRAVLLQTEKQLPQELISAMPQNIYTDAQRNAYLAQFLLDNHLCTNIVDSCDKHYSIVKPDRVPLYMRKSNSH